MKTSYFLSLPLLGCIALASCYPIPDDRSGPPNGPNPDTTITSTEQQKIEEQRALMKEREQKKQEELTTQTPETNGNTTVEKPKDTKSTDYAFANPVPGKEGFVFSPYNNKLVDVRDIPSGTLVQDPTYPAAEKKYFRVP